MQRNSTILSIEILNHSRQYCQITLYELKIIYLRFFRVDRALSEYICENNFIKTYDLEYLLENNRSVDCHIALISCLKILSFYLNNLSELSVPTKIALPSILDEFLILNANVTLTWPCILKH